jgi:hypothetical protein
MNRLFGCKIFCDFIIFMPLPELGSFEALFLCDKQLQAFLRGVDSFLKSVEGFWRTSLSTQSMPPEYA